jgi:tetratricopeptide (TPR) repeat protein
VRFYETCALPQSDEPSVRFDAGQIGLRMADAYKALGRHPEAVSAYRGSIKVLSPLVDRYPAEPKYARQLTEVQYQLARCYSWLGRSDEAEAVEREAVARCERLAASHPEEPVVRRGLAITYNFLANHCQETGRPAEALTWLDKNVAIFQRLFDEHPDDVGIRIELARGLSNLGIICSQIADHTAEAEDLFGRAAPHYEFMTRNHPAESQPDRIVLANFHNNLGYIHVKFGRLSDAIEDFRRAVDHYDALLATGPQSPEVRHEFSVVLFNLGTICDTANRRAEAKVPYERAKALQEPLVAERPGVPRFRFDLAKTEINLAVHLIETGRERSQARLMLETAKGILERLNHDHPNIVGYLGPLAETLAGLGKIDRESGHAPGEAMRSYQDARRILENLSYPTAEELYILAGVQAQCAAFANAGEPRPVGDQPVDPPVSLDQAVATLRRAITFGFHDLNRLRQDTNLDPLRYRTDFQILNMDLAFPADPLSH